MSILLTTTTTTTITDIQGLDNNPLVFVHPVVDEDILLNFDLEDLRQSTSFQTAIDNGDVALTFNGIQVTDLSQIGLSLGRVYRGILPVFASQTLPYTSEIIVYRGTGLTDVLTLPDAAGHNGEVIIVKNQSANDITVDTLGGTIDGFVSVTIQGVLLSAIEFVSDGTDWIAV